MTDDDFERDTYGDLVLRPITTWKTAPLYDLGAILTIKYVEETKPGSIQLVLNLQQCLDLADALIEQAKCIPVRKFQGGNRSN